MTSNFDNFKISKANAINSSGTMTSFGVDKSTESIKFDVSNNLIELLKSLDVDNIEEQMAILEKCKKSGIDLNTISNDVLQKIVTEYKNSKISEVSQVQKTEQNTQVDNNEKQKTDFKSEYNKKDLNGKLEDCYVALARNIYPKGVKDKNNNYIVKPNSMNKSWEELSKPERDQFIQKVKNFIDNDERLKDIKDSFTSTESVDENVKTMMLDMLMRGILAAEFNDISFTDYLKKNEFERAEIVENYLNDNNDTLNENDNYLKNQNEYLKQQVTNILKEKTGIEAENNLDAADVKRYIKVLNLNEDELIYLSLKEKADKGILNDDNDKELYSYYSSLYGTDAGQERLKEAKAQNLHDLEVKYQDLKSKGNLSPAEKRSLEILEKTIASNESKELKKLYGSMPKPTVEEQAVLDDVKSSLNNIEEHVHGSDLESAFLIPEIEKKFADKSKDEKENFIKTYLKFDKSDTANRIYAYYLHKGINVIDKSTNDLGSLHVHEMSNEQADIHHSNILEGYNSENDYDKKLSDVAMKTERKILSKHGNDYQRTSYTDLALNTGNTEYINLGIDVTYSISDDKIKDENVEKIFAHKNTTAENGIYALRNIKDAGKSQYKVLELTTGRWAEATAYASEHNTVSDMDKEYQTKGFETLHTNINKHFEGEEAVKYSKALADQIQNCDKDNQLDMHKEIMTSKYSEVVEHAAGNIKNYDASVQSDAIDTTVASGNTKAIETAYSNLASSPNVVQESAQLRYTIENSLDNTKNEELAQKIKSGATLTREEYDSLTETQKQEYKTAYFQSLSPAKQVEIITKISDVTTKKAIFKKIAESNKNLLRSIIENDVSSAEFVYNLHIADELVLSVAKRKGASMIQFSNLANKIEKNIEKSDYGKTKVNTYMDSPFDVFKIKNKKDKSDIYLA